MRLYYTLPSVFARKCRIVVREKGLLDRVEEVLTDPYVNDPPLVAANPIAQVPALIADDGAVFINSPIICAYLDEVGGGAPLLGAPGAEHWRIVRLAALMDGVVELGAKLTLELRRPETERSPHWIARWREGMIRGLDAVEAEIRSGQGLDMAGITIVAAVDWLDFRHPSLDWRAGRPRLAAVQAALGERAAFVETRPRLA
jgi:glutathione S-transferase